MRQDDFELNFEMRGSNGLRLLACNTHSLSIDNVEKEEANLVKIMFQSLREVLITSWTEDH